MDLVCFPSMSSKESKNQLSDSEYSHQLQQELRAINALISPLLETALTVDEYLRLDDLQEQKEDLEEQISHLQPN